MAALTGLERIAVIAGALVVGYWGYRMMGRDRIPGLVFMSISCLVLGVVLVTGNQRLSDGAGIVAVPGHSGAVAAQATSDDAQDTNSEDSPELSPEASPEVSPEVSNATVAQSAPSATELDTAESETLPASTADTPADDLLSGQELGGRIVSIKSENVTLEWTPQREE